MKTRAVVGENSGTQTVLETPTASLAMSADKDSSPMTTVDFTLDTSLVVPDPSTSPVPIGWWHDTALPIVSGTQSWDELDEIEAQLLAMVSFIESKGRDSLELEKALRIVEKRRGDLAGEPQQGHRTDLQLLSCVKEVPDDISAPALSRYRQFARHWDSLLYPYLLKENDSKAVSQAALLRLIARKAQNDRLNDLTAQACADTFASLYDVLVIDPPWPMKKIERDVRPNQAEFDYPIMSERELAALILPTSANCHVWVWTTQRFLPMSFRLLEEWGLKYVCAFVWHKPGGFQPIGLPQYNCEFALYARRGAPKFNETRAFPTCFTAPRGKHSEKPDEFYDLVRRVTNGKRLDMFNRRAIDGFDGWGKEAAQ